MNIQIQVPDPEFITGVVIANGVTLAPSPTPLASDIDALVSRRATEEFPPPAIKDSIRQMLRKGGFKPSGRNKPASEYLAQAARENRFPRINNLVDINNLLSLESGLPISLLDADIVGPAPLLRYGRENEKYIFNPTGQEIDLEGLVCICGGDTSAPMGNPIKDSMTAKLKDHTSNVIGVIYASTRAINEADMTQVLARFAQLLTTFGGATQTEKIIATGDAP